MARYSALRASDADRDAVAERLRGAAVEGRLEPEELEERLHAALRARTYGDLLGLLADLPAKPVRWQRRGTDVGPAAYTAVAAATRVLAALVLVTVVLAVVVLIAAWWVVWALAWFASCAARGRFGRGVAGPCGWAGPARARRVRAGRPSGVV
jgi:predicted anti-sigma-YlaC factor YlaD